MNEKILRAIDLKNPWWDTKKIPVDFKKKIKRNEFEEIVKYLEEKRITSIIGVRRAGKTTLMYQVIEYLLKTIDQKHIMYINLDEIELIKEENPIKSTIETYLNFVLNTDFKNLKSQIYIFLDEVQYAKNWEQSLKNIWDLNLPIKIFVSGSASLMLLKGLRGGLVGRIHTIEIPPLLFLDFLAFKGIDISVESQEFKKLYDYISKNYYNFIKLKNTILLALNEYILKGGFPEAIDKDLEIWQAFIKEDIVEKVLLQDIPELFDIRDRKLLKNLLIFTANNSSQLISMNSLAGNFNARKETISNYFSYLEKAFLISLIEKYTKSIESRIRTMKKVYILDVGVMNAVKNIDKKIFRDEVKMGNIIETIVALHCRNFAKKNLGNLYYWRDKQKREVDFIIEYKGEILPVEVKYKEQIREQDLRNLRYFMRKNNIKFGILVTKDLFEKREDILLIPAWIFFVVI